MSTPYQSILKEPTTHLPMAYRKYTDQVTGVSVVAETSTKIADKVREIRVARGLPTDGIQREVEEFICMSLPSWCSRRIDGPMVKHEYTKADVLAFIESVKGTIQSGGVVPQTVAETRATACLQCPYNLKLAGCEGCNGISSFVFSILGGRRVRNISLLKSCGICGCSLKAKIWVPQEVLEQTSHIQNTKGQFPSWCWVEKKETR